MMKLNVLLAIGVPDKAPVAALRVRPGGSAPTARVKMYGSTPPVADNVWLKGVPTMRFGISALAGSMVIVEQLTVRT